MPLDILPFKLNHLHFFFLTTFFQNHLSSLNFLKFNCYISGFVTSELQMKQGTGGKL